MKAIIIDGPALFCMKGALNIKDYNFKTLYEIFTKHVGRNKHLLYGQPIITLRPRLATTLGISLGKSFLGYKVVSVDNTIGKDGLPEDDRYVIEHLKKIEVKKVTEIVLVGTDSDFAKPFLEKLQAIAAEHPNENLVRGYVVGTRLQEDGYSSVGQAMETLFAEYSEIVEFVELSEFKGLEFSRPIFLPDAHPAPPPAQEPPEAAPSPQNGNGYAEAAEEPDGGVSVVFETADGKIAVHPRSLTTELLTALSLIQREMPEMAVSYE